MRSPGGQTDGLGAMTMGTKDGKMLSRLASPLSPDTKGQASSPASGPRQWTSLLSSRWGFPPLI